MKHLISNKPVELLAQLERSKANEHGTFTYSNTFNEDHAGNYSSDEGNSTVDLVNCEDIVIDCFRKIKHGDTVYEQFRLHKVRILDNTKPAYFTLVRGFMNMEVIVLSKYT